MKRLLYWWKYRRKVRVAEFIAVSPFMSSDAWKRVEALPLLMVDGNAVPENLNDLTLGDLFDLQGCRDYVSLMMVSARVLMHIPDEVVMWLPADQLCGLANHVLARLRDVAQLFEQCRVEPTIEEKQAGVEALRFGAFGIVDHFALRMGITHDAALATPWLQVWQALKIDAEKTAYERRLHESYKNKIKR